MLHWWKMARRAEAAAHCGEGAGHGHHEHHEASHGHDDFGGGGSFGVRRPLRFLAHKLDLNEKQVESLARILSDLKTERAQAAVDDRRVLGAIADIVAGETFDPAKAASATGERVKSAERLRDAVVTALGQIHALLEPSQREKLAYMIRTGTLVI
jgi:Spy/CpxP family protein refolding chaperone